MSHRKSSSHSGSSFLAEMARTTSSDRPLGNTCGSGAQQRSAGGPAPCCDASGTQYGGRQIVRVQGRQSSARAAGSGRARCGRLRGPATHVTLDDGLEAILVGLGQQLGNLLVLALLARIGGGALHLRRRAHLRRARRHTARRGVRARVCAVLAGRRGLAKRRYTHAARLPGGGEALSRRRRRRPPPQTARRQPAALSAHLQAQRLAGGPRKAPPAAAPQRGGAARAPPAAGGHCRAHAARVTPSSR